MELSSFVKLMMIVVPLFGAISGSVLPEICPQFTKQYCACNDTEKAKLVPLTMCLNENGCVPCGMDGQDHIDCSVCPGNTCPTCSENEFSLQEVMKKKTDYEKALFARLNRKSRDAWDPLPHDTWCVFNRNMLNGQVECTFTTYSKECMLSCYEPYTVNGRKELSFVCKRKENIWHPDIQSCEDTSRENNAPAFPENPEEPHHSMQKMAELKSGNDRSNDFQFGDHEGAAARATDDDHYIYDSDDGTDDKLSQLVKVVVNSHTGDSLFKDEGENSKIDEGILKDFYDLLISE